MIDSSTLFWITSRAAGTCAMVLSSTAVGFGLVMSGRLIKGNASDRRTIHEILALSTMVAIAVHGLALLGDSFVHFTLPGIAIPFLGSYRTLTTSIGIIAGWGMIILGLSFYLRNRIGISRWKVLHRFTALAWALGLIHTFTAGTDAGKLWFIALIILTAAPAVWMLILRLGRPSAPSGGARSGRAVSAAGPRRAPSVP